MMPYPFSRFSYYNYPHNSHFNNGYVNNFKGPCNASSVKNFQNDIADVSKKETHNSCSNDLDIGSDSVDFFEIFGLKLYFDDILLICIIFFSL